MNYIRKNFPNERIIYETRLHWKIFILPILSLIFAGYLYSDDRTWLSSIFGVGGALYLLAMAIEYFTNEFVITTNNLYLRQGLFPRTNRIPLTKITRVELKARYNPIDILLDSGGMVCVTDGNEKIEFKNIASPRGFDNRANRQLNNPQIESGEQALSGSIQPVKATPVSPSELERVQSEFKYYSPAQKPYKTAPLPKVGETWRLERALPSGLNFLLNTDDSYKNEIKELLKWKLLGITPYRDFDERPYVYDTEKFLSEDPRRNIQCWETESISWHPTKKWLVTAGTGNLAKLWDVENGNMITKHPIWDTKSYAPSQADGTLCWSYDGAMFVSFNNSYDGNTGERLTRNLLQDFSSYSNQDYHDLRGGEYRADGFRTTSPFSSTNNFSLWRPNSEQFMNGRNEENLILRNRCTGEIEKIIDCGVISKIKDFAWHPKGRFIAVTFENDNIRVIDLDDAKIVADLSVQNLVGWSPDGKILVARKEKFKDDFVIWDALETEEKPIPEEIKNELWFKRFFKNMSADGLRYIKIEHDENYVRSTNIYSVESDELVATLPKEVTSAAWCPIDGGLLATCGKGETQKGETHIWRI